LTQIKEKTFIGLDILRRFLDGGHSEAAKEVAHLASQPTKRPASSLAKRVIACLDVRSNDAGDLVVTKGDQYDVREQTSDREVRNLGKPVELAGRYFKDGADEVSSSISTEGCPAGFDHTPAYKFTNFSIMSRPSHDNTLTTVY
jgi:hypothetical protein